MVGGGRVTAQLMAIQKYEGKRSFACVFKYEPRLLTSPPPVILPNLSSEKHRPSQSGSNRQPKVITHKRYHGATETGKQVARQASCQTTYDDDDGEGLRCKFLTPSFLSIIHDNDTSVVSSNETRVHHYFPSEK